MGLPFPNVPFAPGVPQIPRSPQVAVSEVITLATPAPLGSLWAPSDNQPTWDILDPDGNSAVDADAFINFGNENEANIPNFPVEQGSFATYNTVVLPYTIQVRLSKGGSLADRTQFLMDIESMWQSLDLYTIVTPENDFQDMNLERYEVQRRGAGGAFFLTEVDLFFIQIQQVTAQYSTTQNAQNPSAQPVTNAGNVQTSTPSAEVQGQVTTGLDNTSGYPTGF